MERATAIRARIARAQQMGAPAEQVDSLRRDYYASRAIDYVRDWITSDPAPTAAHRAEVAALLLDGAADAA